MAQSSWAPAASETQASPAAPDAGRTGRFALVRRRVQLPWSITLPLAAGLALGIGSLSIIRLIARPLGLLIISITLAEALEPLVGRFERRMRRGFAIGVAYLLVLAGFGLLGWLVVPTLIAQGGALIARGPAIMQVLEHWLVRADAVTNGSVTQLLSAAQRQVASVVVAIPLQLLSTVTDLLVILFLSIYWLAGAPGMLRFVLSLVPEHRAAKVRQVAHDMGQAMGGYVRGAAINAAIMGVLAFVALLLVGVNYPVALGVLTGLGEPFPYVGPIAAAVPVVLVALLQSPTKALIALGLYCFLQEFEGHVLTPNVMERQTNIPQTLVILAIVVGATLGGILGIIVAIPAAAALHVFVKQVVAPAVRRLTGSTIDPTPEAREALAPSVPNPTPPAPPAARPPGG